MSFVYAFKSDNSIYMIGDTKVTIDDRGGVENFKSKRKLVEYYGILKTIILTDDIGLGFAGNNLNCIEEALKELFERKSQQKNIVEILKDYSCGDDTAPSFILIYKNELIFLIENGTVEERENCYIGSPVVFNELQKRRNNRPIDFNILSLIQNIFKDDIDKEVGGFCTKLRYNICERKYKYIETLDSTVTKERFIPSGATLPLVDSAENGGFTYSTFPIMYNEGKVQYLAIHITQNKKTYLYVPMVTVPPCDCLFKHLFLPFDISDRI